MYICYVCEGGININMNKTCTTASVMERDREKYDRRFKQLYRERVHVRVLGVRRRHLSLNI